MLKEKKCITVMTLFLYLQLALFGTNAQANIQFDKLYSADTHNEIIRFKQQVLTASDLQEAKKIALEPTENALDSLNTALQFIDSTPKIEHARKTLLHERLIIEKATSKKEVVDHLAGVMLASLDDDSLASVGVGDVDCSYSTGETIAIVIGLILGIIPGLILLALLC